MCVFGEGGACMCVCSTDVNIRKRVRMRRKRQREEKRGCWIRSIGAELCLVGTHTECEWTLHCRVQQCSTYVPPPFALATSISAVLRNLSTT